MSEEPSVGIKSASSEQTGKPASTADAAAQRLSIFQKAKGFLFRRNQQINGNQESAQSTNPDGAGSNQGNGNRQENPDSILDQGNQAVSPDKPVPISNKAARDNKGRFVSVKTKVADRSVADEPTGPPSESQMSEFIKETLNDQNGPQSAPTASEGDTSRIPQEESSAEKGTALENWLENLNDEQRNVRNNIIESRKKGKKLFIGRAEEILLTPSERELRYQLGAKVLRSLEDSDKKLTPEEIKQFNELNTKLGLKVIEENRQKDGGGSQNMPTTPEQVEEVRKGIKNRLANVKIFGQPATDLLAGMATGAGVRLAARMGLAIGGVGGLPYFAAAGAAAGGATRGVKEYLHQRRDIKQENSEELAQIRSRLKREFRIAKATNKYKLGTAFAKGAAYGAVGGVIGAGMVDILHSELVQDKIGGVAKFAMETAGHAVKFAGDQSAPVTHVIQETAGPTVNAVKDFVEPVTKPILEKTGLIREAAKESPKPDIQNPAGVKVELPPGSTPGIVSTEPIMAGDIPAPESIIPLAEAAVMPDSISLPPGSNPWNEVSKYLEGNLGRPPTNSEIMEITKIVAKESDISVPAWGIDGSHLDTQLPPGYKLVFDDKVKSAIQRLSDHTPSGIPTTPPDISNIPTPTIGETVPSPDSAMPPVYNRFGNPPEFNRFAPHLDNPFNRPLPENIPVGPQPTETLLAPQDFSSSLENLHAVDPKSAVLSAAKTGGLPHQDSIANNAILSSNQAAIETANSAFNPVEKISLSGSLNSISSVREFLAGYTEQNLGRKATDGEFAKIMAKVFSDNQITDPAKLSEIKELRLSGANQFISQIASRK